MPGRSVLRKPLADAHRRRTERVHGERRHRHVGRLPLSRISGGVNTSGWHFHFVDDARKLGGHVLDVAPDLVAALDRSRVLTLALPDDPDFDRRPRRRAGDAGLPRGDPSEAHGAGRDSCAGSTDLRGEPERSADVHAAPHRRASWRRRSWSSRRSRDRVRRLLPTRPRVRRRRPADDAVR